MDPTKVLPRVNHSLDGAPSRSCVDVLAGKAQVELFPLGNAEADILNFEEDRTPLTIGCSGHGPIGIGIGIGIGIYTSVDAGGVDRDVNLALFVGRLGTPQAFANIAGNVIEESNAGC